MSTIEWESDHTYQPAARRLEDFYQAYGLARPPGLPRAFVAQNALESLHQHLESDLHREHGGVLAGLPYLDPERQHYYADVQVAIPALEAEGSPVHLQFTPQAWEFIAGRLEEDFPELVVVGWYHSHPGLGIFMSGTDRAAHAAFYRQPWSLALVVDPTAQTAGWFHGPNSTPLHSTDLVVYGVGRGVHTPPATSPASSRRRDLGWLLPLVLLSLSLWIGVWRFLRLKG